MILASWNGESVTLAVTSLRVFELTEMSGEMAGMYLAEGDKTLSSDEARELACQLMQAADECEMSEIAVAQEE